MAVAQRLELLLIVAGAWALALGLPRHARADGGNCVDACVAAFGVAYVSNNRLYVLTDCATSELGTGTVWCQYVGTAL
jgi:hypothetical protein